MPFNSKLHFHGEDICDTDAWILNRKESQKLQAAQTCCFFRPLIGHSESS